MENDTQYFCWSERRGGWVRVSWKTWRLAGFWNERKRSDYGPFIARRDY